MTGDVENCESKTLAAAMPPTADVRQRNLGMLGASWREGDAEKSGRMGGLMSHLVIARRVLRPRAPRSVDARVRACTAASPQPGSRSAR
jgi:hypothetical protein